MVIWLVAAGGVLVVCNVCRCMEAQGFLDALQLRRTSADDNSERRILGTRTSPATRHGLAATWLWCSVQMYNAHGKPHSFSRALPSSSGTNARFQCSTPSTQRGVGAKPPSTGGLYKSSVRHSSDVWTKTQCVQKVPWNDVFTGWTCTADFSRNCGKKYGSGTGSIDRDGADIF